MKYLLILMIFVSSQSFAGILFSSPAQIEAGETFTIDVAFEHESGATYDEIIGFDFAFEFTNSIADLTSLALAEPFNSNGDWELFIDVDYANALNFEVFSADPFDLSKNKWHILSFNFTAKEAGAFSLNIIGMNITGLYYIDDSDESFAIGDNNTQLAIENSTAQASAPTMFSLILLGVGLVLYRRKGK